MFVYSDFDWSRSLTKIILIKFIVDSKQVIWHTFNVIFRLALIIEEWIYFVFASSKHNLKIPQQYSLHLLKGITRVDCRVWGGGGGAGQALNNSVMEQELSHKRVWFSFPLQMRRFFHYATPLGHEKLQTYCVACVKRLESHFICHCSELKWIAVSLRQ